MFFSNKICIRLICNPRTETKKMIKIGFVSIIKAEIVCSKSPNLNHSTESDAKLLKIKHQPNSTDLAEFKLVRRSDEIFRLTIKKSGSDCSTCERSL